MISIRNLFEMYILSLLEQSFYIKEEDSWMVIDISQLESEIL